MKVTFLGTGTSMGVPVIGCNCDVCRSQDPKDKRLRSSVMIQTDGNTFVFDTGPDFRQQMLREQVNHLTAVIFTHEHKDHTAGMDDVRAFNFVQQKAIPIYAHPRVQEALKREFAYVFSAEKYPGIPEIDLIDIGSSSFTIEGTTFQPIQVLHHRLPVLGFRVGDFTYITDANYISEEEKEKVKGSKVIVLNALRKQDHLSHFTLAEAVSLMQELQPEKGYFIHISHQMGRHAEVQAELPEFIELAYDGLRVEV